MAHSRNHDSCPVTATLVIQSQRFPLPFAWLQACLDSVAGWARLNGYEYRFLGDEIFDQVVPALLEKAGGRSVIATDLARLALLQRGLDQGFDRVVWCDADFLIFRPEAFVLPPAEFALGREVWVQLDQGGRPRAYPKVHNALLMFQRANRFLEFYADTAQRLVRLYQGGMPPQFIGPKLLTALHNIARFPVMETAGMLSPCVMRDILNEGGDALTLFLQESPAVLAGANLSSSLSAREGFGDAEMESLIRKLLVDGL